jgi:hypothetical protein
MFTTLWVWLLDIHVGLGRMIVHTARMALPTYVEAGRMSVLGFE